MSIELIRNNDVRVEMIKIYTNELSQNKDEHFPLFLATEREKILHQIKIDSGVYKGKLVPSSRNYFKGFSDAHTFTIMKKYISFLVNHLKTNKTLSPTTKEYISSKIGVSYSQVGKILRKFERKKEKQDKNQN
jgi:hypothetical protein